MVDPLSYLGLQVSESTNTWRLSDWKQQILNMFQEGEQTLETVGDIPPNRKYHSEFGPSALRKLSRQRLNVSFARLRFSKL